MIPRIPMVLLSAMLTAGCAGIMNPHVDSARNYDREAGPVSIAQGFAYADGMIDAYNDAMGNNAKLESSAGAAFLLLSVGALGNGITGGSQNSTAWLGLAGATSYGLGAFLTNKPKRLIYAAGSGAMTCVKHAMVPYNISAAEQRAFQHAIAVLSSQMGEIRAYANENNNQNFRNSYAAVLESGLRLNSMFRQAGELMVASVDRVAADVNTALVNSTPDLSSVQPLLESITSAHGQIPVPEVPEDPDAENLQQTALNTLTPVEEGALPGSALCANRADCAEVIRLVARQYRTALPVEALQACGVQQAIISPLEISPAASRTVKKPASGERTELFFVSGGSGRYLAEEATQADAAPKLSQNPPFGPRLEITISQDTEAGTYSFIVYDSTNDRRTVVELVIQDAGS